MIEFSRMRPGTSTTTILAAITFAAVTFACSSPQTEQQSTNTAQSPDAAGAERRADHFGVPQRLDFPVSDPNMRGIEVASHVDDVAVERHAPVSAVDARTMRAEIPRMAAPRRRGFGHPVPDGMFEESPRRLAAGPAGRTRSTARLRVPSNAESMIPSGGLSVADDPSARAGLPFVVEQFDTIDFDQNANVTGFFSIPPDSHIAAGPNHVMTVVNTSVQAFSKSGGKQLEQSLRNFFAPLGPLTGTFDPKVLYDTQAGRWVVVTLEQTDRAFDPADTSRIFVAASDDSNPTGTWFMTAIDARTMIGGRDRWADYPGFGVDEEAIYIATNMFAFTAGSGSFGGVRLWIVPKGALYNGQAVNVRRVDPYANPDSFALTTQPAQFYGNSGGVGGMLLGYSGLNNGTDAFVQLMRVNNPLGAVQVSGPNFVNLGPIDQIAAALPDAPQQGSSQLIVTNDRRMLNATWINGMLYGAFTVRAGGQATAHWVELVAGASGTPSVGRQASIPGEELGASTHTYFPAVAANERGDVTVGYSASSPSIFAGSYYSIYPADGSLADAGEPQLLRAGQGPYFRQFGSSNRWGDYSGAVIDPVDGCFWIFNQHADTPGTPLSGGQGDGRWATSASKVCLALGFAQAPEVEPGISGTDAQPELPRVGRRGVATRPVR